VGRAASQKVSHGRGRVASWRAELAQLLVSDDPESNHRREAPARSRLEKDEGIDREPDCSCPEFRAHTPGAHGHNNDPTPCDGAPEVIASRLLDASYGLPCLPNV